MITIIGSTACGKTQLAVAVSAKIGSEIISGDSRQVYRRMNIGSGKDLIDYTLGDCKVPYHLIDIVEPGTKYTVFDFQQDFLKAYTDICNRRKIPVFCGGSGLYVESILRSYNFHPVPRNEKLRRDLENKSLLELTKILSSHKVLHNTTDLDTVRRVTRAIEIEVYYQNNFKKIKSFPHIPSINFGISVPKEIRRKMITDRLQFRLKNGMIEEICSLLNSGIHVEDLIYYGLEYKYVTLYVIGVISYEEMFSKLEIAIHQFAKRQMTWFRGMERRGILIHWIDGLLPVEDKVEQVLHLYRTIEE